MPRLSYIGALLGVAAFLSVSSHAQTSALSSASASPRVQHVEVRGSGDNLEVEIQTSGPSVAPDTQAIAGPDRIVVDFPGALPAAELHALKVNRGVLKGVRSGLFFNNPPITRVVLDLTEPQSYQISAAKNSIIVKLGPAVVASVNSPASPVAGKARLQNASLATGSSVAPARVSPAIANAVSNPVAPASPAVSEAQPLPPPPPPVTVTFENGMLRIHADKATLAQVLFEVQRQTQAEIAIPAGAEREQVAAELGPAPARDVLGSLLNGSSYNFIFVGNESKLERVILTRRDPSIF